MVLHSSTRGLEGSQGTLQATVCDGHSWPQSSRHLSLPQPVAWPPSKKQVGCFPTDGQPLCSCPASHKAAWVPFAFHVLMAGKEASRNPCTHLKASAGRAGPCWAAGRPTTGCWSSHLGRLPGLRSDWCGRALSLACWRNTAGV